MRLLLTGGIAVTAVYFFPRRRLYEAEAKSLPRLNSFCQIHLFLNLFRREHVSPIKISLDLTGHGKSISCQENTYLLELVRYIHLNPIRAGIVKDLKSLDRYAYTGHSVIMGKRKNPWQDTDSVLQLFGKSQYAARKKYRDFVDKGICRRRNPEMTGGGLLRSIGGWGVLKSMRRMGAFRGDGEILTFNPYLRRCQLSAKPLVP